MSRRCPTCGHDPDSGERARLLASLEVERQRPVPRTPADIPTDPDPDAIVEAVTPLRRGRRA